MRKNFFIQGYKSFYFKEYRFAVYLPGRYACQVAGLTWPEAVGYVEDLLRSRRC